MDTNPFITFEKSVTDQELEQFQTFLREEGFTGFRLFIEGFRERLKRFDDHEVETVRTLLQRAKTLFPDPSAFSPSWALIWEEFDQIISYKELVMETVSVEEREGEWQVLLDNPFTNSDLVCYPSLSFLEGAYMYAYFRSDLKQNEYIRLQKIQNVIMAFGSEHSTQKEKSKDH